MYGIVIFGISRTKCLYFLYGNIDVNANQREVSYELSVFINIKIFA